MPPAAAVCTAIAPRLLTRSLPPPPAMPTPWTSRFAEQLEDFPAGATAGGATLQQTRPSLTTQSFPRPAASAVGDCWGPGMMPAVGRMLMLSSPDLAVAASVLLPP